MRILKRKKGNEEFYYIQNSFRKDGKVITKEKYLGKEIPKNIEEIKRIFREESRFDLIKKLKCIMLP